MHKLEERFCQEFPLCEAERFFPGRVEMLEVAIKTGDTQHIDRESKKLVTLLLCLEDGPPIEQPAAGAPGP